MEGSLPYFNGDESRVESPKWHEDVLRERDEAVKAGEETFIDWEEAKRQLRARCSG
jgi:hypothetical protein